MTEACLLSPPAGAGRKALETHLRELRAISAEEALVQMAIEDAEHMLDEMRKHGD
jgi:hypothetical protein